MPTHGLSRWFGFLADNDLEYAKVTPKVVLGRAWLLCSRVFRQATIQVHELRPALALDALLNV